MDITAVGEVLIDLTQSEENEYGIPVFAANPGGAPANLSVAASRLGAKTAFVGRVGKDSFGKYLKEVLEENGVDISGLSEDPVQHTTLAVVSVDKQGERSFSFYRDPSADVNLSAEDLPESLLSETRFLHFGSVSLTAEPSRSATLAAAKRAREHGALISFDPNYRESLWKDEQTAVREIKAALPLADILKVSDEEMTLLTGCTDPAEGSLALMAAGIPMVLVTLGADGAYYRTAEYGGHLPGYACKVADTNGAGDTFFGAFLSKLAKTEHPLAVSEKELREMVDFANRAASVTTSRHGAIPAMPSLKELEN